VGFILPGPPTQGKRGKATTTKIGVFEAVGLCKNFECVTSSRI
jgi:hypothetical protein